MRVSAELDVLAPIQALARERGCLWIKFDEEGPVIEELPVFDR